MHEEADLVTIMINNNNNIMKQNLNLQIPQEVIIEVLSYLPAESVLKFKFVCKTWRALLDDPYFAEIHTGKLPLHYDDSLSLLVWARRQQTADSFFQHLYLWDVDHEDFIFQHLGDVDYEDDDEKVCKSFSNNQNKPLPPPLQDASHSGCNFAFAKKNITIGSCNGLVCLALGYNFQLHSSIFVNNPMTREYVRLPNYDHDESEYIAQGFGFHPVTRKYKIIRLYSYRQSWNPNVQNMQIHIYTLGSGIWRIKQGQHTPYDDDDDFHSIGVPFNGSVYWMRPSKRNILSFDLEVEEIRTIPSPPHGTSSKDRLHMLVLGGNLCVSEQVRYGIDIWVMKNEKNSHQVCSWTKNFNIPESIEVDQGPNVTPQFDIYDAFYFKPLLLTKAGKIICHSSFYKNLISFDPKTQSCFLLKEYTEDLPLFGQDITYIKSIVSLKALGEKEVLMTSISSTSRFSSSRML